MLKTTLLGTLLVGLVLAGCGSNDSDKDSDAGPNGGSGNGASGNGGGGASGANSTGQSGTGGNAGTAAATDGGLPLTCDTSITNVASCGSETCTAPSGLAAQACSVSCCTADNKCGSKNTSTEAMGSALANCALPAEEDQRCAGVFGGGGGGGFTTPCCTADGFCGISFANMGCFDPSSQTGGAPVKCDEAGTGNDAGVN